MSENSEQEYVDMVSLMNEVTDGGLTKEQEDIFRNSCGAAGSYGFISGIQFVQSLIPTYANGVEQYQEMWEDLDIDTVKSYSESLRRMLDAHLRGLMDKYENNMNSAFPNKKMSTSTAENHNE